MDNAALENALLEGAQKLGLTLDRPVARQLLDYEQELLRWNGRVNLVGRRNTPFDVMEKHLLDCLAAAPEIAPAQSLIDIGAGAGLPGIPLKVMQPDLDVTLVEVTGKKVAFLRSAIEKLDLGPGIRVRHVRAEGAPDREKLPRAQVAISRALAPLPEWLSLGIRYGVPGGRVIAMMARAEDAPLRKAAERTGAKVLSIRRYELPFSHAARTLAVFQLAA